MHEFEFLDELVIICTSSLGVLLLFSRLRIPPVIGLIVTGLLLGPSCFAIVKQDAIINVLSELGVVMLLFTIGLEFSLDDLRSLKKIVLVGGPLQIILSTMVIGAGAYVVGGWTGFNLDWKTATFIGMALALSSTAICLKILKERRELDQPQGRAVVGILIFQDIAVVPMMVVVGLLSPYGNLTLVQIALKLVVLVVTIVGLTAIMRIILPRVVSYVTRANIPEVLIIGALAVCFGVAYITSQVGLSMALGAFIAGVAIAESEDGHVVGKVMEPLRDAFTSIFFVSIGLLVHFDLQSLPLNIFSAIAIIIVNALVVGVLLILLGIPARIAIMAGIIMSQVGEFSFVLATTGREYGVIDNTVYQNMLVSIIITMIVTPGLITLAPKLAESALPVLRFMPLARGKHKADPDPVDTGSKEAKPVTESDVDVSVIGMGVVSTNVTRILAATGMSYKVLDINRVNVDLHRERGVPIFHGDAADEDALRQIGVHVARAVIIAISDQSSIAAVVRAVRKVRPDVTIIARTRYAGLARMLERTGADVVITEEYESSIQVIVELLQHLGVPETVCDEQEKMLRENRYGMFAEL